MKRYTQDDLLLIWLDSFSKISYENKQRLFERLKGKQDIKKLIIKSRDEFSLLVGDDVYSQLCERAENDYFAEILSEVEKRRIVAITVASDDYPELLKQTTEPPLVIYAKGNIELLSTDVFGVVGSRKCLPLSQNVCKEYVSSLLGAGFTVVTGIAEGIDKTVIQTAIENNGRVISVLAGGFDNVYPKQHEELVSAIISKGGVVITEYTPTTSVMPYNFPVRNRIIAGLSKGVLIVCAGKKSGTLYTAEYAEEYGRDLFAVPYSVGVASGVGTNDLIKRGAFLTDTALDILSFYGLSEQTEIVEQKLDADEEKIVSVLKEGPLHIEKICEKTGKKIFEISSYISLLEIKGIIVKAGINVYGLGKNIPED